MTHKKNMNNSERGKITMVREMEVDEISYSNEKVPLSEIMGNFEVACPLCGNKLPVEVKDMVIDGQTFNVCKQQCVKQGQKI